MDGTIELSGEIVPAVELEVAKARELAESLQIQRYVSLVQCMREPGGEEVVMFDVEVELPQKRVYNIRRRERIAVRFDPEDESLPDTLALRADFPETPHLNRRVEEFPRSLCLFETPYAELKLRWTAPFYVRNVREWLALTARGELHTEDQPLEPLLYGSEGYLVYPKAVLDPEDPVGVLVIDQVTEVGARQTYVATAAASLESPPDGIQLLAMVLRAEPQTHGVIHSNPKNLRELHSYLKPVGLDLLERLRQQLRDWNSHRVLFDAVRDARLIIFLHLPKMRHADDAAHENVEPVAFVTQQSIVEVGGDVGVWETLKDEIGVFAANDTTKTGENVRLKMLNPLLDFSSEQASLLSGLDQGTDIRIAAVGAGALGSQVTLNLIRMGYGRWELIDDDVLLPHNLARHALTRSFVGHSKVAGLAFLGCQMVNDPAVARPFVENVLGPSKPDALEAAFSDAQVILDISTSIAVARHLTHDVASNARRISLFLNPTASDVVILAEDDERHTKLDLVEMQYYRELIQNPDLRGHLQRDDERVRYGTSCRDLSSRIPQDLVALHSAICSCALRQIIEDGSAAVMVWSADPDEMTTQKYSAAIGRELRMDVGDWTVVTDGLLLERISQMRASKLPNETGGVLVGSHDTGRKIVYVVDLIPAPPDSVEWPRLFIRGVKGLRQQVQRIRSTTDNQLVYVGEWHSHPPGAGGQQSEDDAKAFRCLSGIMADDGLPALMVISAANGQSVFYMGKMEDGRLAVNM